MKITRELIEKYHLNQCTSLERRLVEEWLDNPELDHELESSSAIASDQLEDEIWKSLSGSIRAAHSNQKKRFPFGKFQLSIAASLIALIIASAGVWWYNGTATRPSMPIALSNMENSTSPLIEADGLMIAMAPRSKANVTATTSQSTRSIDFCGAMSIETEKDVQLTFKSICANGETHSEMVNLKKGETYIAFNYRFVFQEELFVVNSRDMADLPPALRRQFAQLF